MALEYGLPIQEHILASLLSDEDFLKQHIGIMDPEYFSDEILRDIAGVCWEFFKKQKESPVKDALLLEIKGAMSPGRKYGEYAESIERIYDKFGTNTKHFQEKLLHFIQQSRKL